MKEHLQIKRSTKFHDTQRHQIETKNISLKVGRKYNVAILKLFAREKGRCKYLKYPLFLIKHLIEYDISLHLHSPT